MELRQLRYFVAVAEEGNISRAARKIFLTQSALSRQIKALEDELGVRLLERQAHSIKLTAAGEMLLQEGRELLLRADQVKERVRTENTGPRLRVGYAPSFGAGILSAAVCNFTQAHPGATVELFDLSTKEMLAGLESGQLDLAITLRCDAADRDLTWVPVLETPWSLAVGSRHPLREKTMAAALDLGREKLCMFCRSEYPEYWDTVSAWLREQRLRPEIAAEYDGIESMMAAVAAGLGVALVPTTIGRLYPGRVRSLNLKAGPAEVAVHAGFRTKHKDTRVLRVFVEELKAASAKLGEPFK